MTVLCATGHRPNKLGGYSVNVRINLVALANRFLARTRPDKVISGMALGWDQAWAEAAFGLSIPFIAAVPCLGQEKLWPLKSRQHYFDLLRLADEVKLVCQGTYEPWMMFARNEWMVDNSDGMVALWNGETSGGTYDAVKYAERRQQARPEYQIINLWPEWEKMHA